MTTHEIVQEHIDKKCKECKISNCNGIFVTDDGKTRCQLTMEGGANDR